jgi:hypothetical protein
MAENFEQLTMNHPSLSQAVEKPAQQASNHACDDNELEWDELSVSLCSSTPSEAGEIMSETCSSITSDFADPLHIDEDDNTNPVLLNGNEYEDLKDIIGQSEMPKYFQSEARLIIACSNALQKESKSLSTRIDIHNETINDLEVATKRLNSSTEVEFKRSQDLIAQLFRRIYSVESLNSNQGLALRKLAGVTQNLLAERKATQKRETHMSERVDTLELAIGKSSLKSAEMESRLLLSERVVMEQAEKIQQSERAYSQLMLQTDVVGHQVMELDRKFLNLKNEMNEAVNEAAQNGDLEMNELRTKLTQLEHTFHNNYKQVHKDKESTEGTFKALVDFRDHMLARADDMENRLLDASKERQNATDFQANEFAELYEYIQRRATEQNQETNERWNLNQKTLQRFRDDIDDNTENIDSVLTNFQNTNDGLDRLRKIQEEDRHVIGGIELTMSAAQRTFCATWEKKIEGIENHIHTTVRNSVESKFNTSDSLKVTGSAYQNSVNNLHSITLQRLQKEEAKLRGECNSIREYGNKTRLIIDTQTMNHQNDLDKMKEALDGVTCDPEPLNSLMERVSVIERSLTSGVIPVEAKEACEVKKLDETIGALAHHFEELNKKIGAIEQALTPEAIRAQVNDVCEIQTMEKRIKVLEQHINDEADIGEEFIEDVLAAVKTVMKDGKVWSLIADVQKRLDGLETSKEKTTTWAKEFRNALTMKFDAIFARLDSSDAYENSATEYAQNLRVSIDTLEGKLVRFENLCEGRSMLFADDVVSRIEAEITNLRNRAMLEAQESMRSYTNETEEVLAEEPAEWFTANGFSAQLKEVDEHHAAIAASETDYDDEDMFAGNDTEEEIDDTASQITVISRSQKATLSIIERDFHDVDERDEKDAMEYTDEDVEAIALITPQEKPEMDGHM